ncbi:MAG: type II toxin-antitoxin system PemK/MazF family toxin [Candidatus Desantisbacteria bacterium]
MTTFSHGEVILVPFPFTDQTTVKQRPAVVISSDEYNLYREDVIIAAITSVVSIIRLGDYRLRDWEKAGLVKPSVVKAALATVHKNMVKRKMGVLTQTDLNGLNQNLIKILGLEGKKD